MKKNPKTKTTKVCTLVDPQLQFVSIVERAANQTPLNIVKNLDNESIKSKDDNQMNNSVDFHKFSFSKDVFTEKDKVDNYLTNKGYSDFSIEENDTSFIVEAKPFDDFKEGSISEMKADTGVDIQVGILASNLIDSQQSEDSIKEVEKQTSSESDTGKRIRKSSKSQLIIDNKDSYAIVKKYEEYLAYLDDKSRTIKDIMQTGADGIPPGFDTLNSAFVAALRNNILNKDFTNIKNLTSEYGDLIISLAEVFMSATIPQEEMNKFFTSENTSTQQSVKKTQDEISQVNKQINNLEQVINKSSDFLKVKIADLTKKLDDFDNKFNSSQLSITERLDNLESIEQTKKSISVGDVVETQQIESTDDELSDSTLFRDRIGFGRN